MTSANRKEPNFDAIARPYRWLEYLTLGTALRSCRTYYLPRLMDRRRALILGDGDGRFTARLLQVNPEIQAVAVDISGGMLALLRDRCDEAAPNSSTRLQTVQRSALTYTPDAETDLIVSHFFLDCLTQAELDGLVPRLTRHTCPDTLWLISDFQIPANALRLPARIFIRGLYFAFRLLTGLRTERLPDHATPLSAAGFVRIDHHCSLGGMLATELWQKAPSRDGAAA